MHQWLRKSSFETQNKGFHPLKRGVLFFDTLKPNSNAIGFKKWEAKTNYCCLYEGVFCKNLETLSLFFCLYFLQHLITWGCWRHRHDSLISSFVSDLCSTWTHSHLARYTERMFVRLEELFCPVHHYGFKNIGRAAGAGVEGWMFCHQRKISCDM